jgi:hypothetical protein
VTAQGGIRPLRGLVSAAVAAGVGFCPQSAAAAGGGAGVTGLRHNVEDRQPEKIPPAGQTKLLDKIEDVHDAIGACWLPPPIEQARDGMQITVIVSFTRSGEILGEPRFSYLTPEATKAQRAAYQKAVAETLSRCTPFRFSPGLGNALAGRPFALRFIETRTTRPPGRAT